MTKSKTWNRGTFPFYPFLLACYPVLSLFQANFYEVEPRLIVRPLVISILLAVAVFAITLGISRNLDKSAAFTSLVIVLFFSYGHAHNIFSGMTGVDFFLAHHRWLLVLYFLIFSTVSWLIFAKFKGSQQLTGIFNLCSVALVVLPLVQIIGFEARQMNFQSTQSQQETGLINSPSQERKPDIYYIILDMYTRGDALKDDFKFDNSQFIQALEKRGFYVAKCSRSNYVQTELSLGSSLNMEYLQNLSPGLDPQAENMDGMVGYIKDNRVRKILEKAGYKTVAFDTGYFWDSWTDARYYFSPTSSSSLISKLTPFEGLYVNTTALQPLVESRLLFSQKMAAEIENPVQAHIDRETYKLDKLGEIAGISGPKFVFAHIMIPHFPFVFRRDGSIQTDIGYYSNRNGPIDEQHYLDGYVQQVEFINQQILSRIDKILETSKNPPVIILQGDHGARDASRLAILNAYYLPSGNSGLYPGITPVNTFRLIFDQYLNGDFGLLPDMSYYSAANSPFQFEERAESYRDCLP